MTKKLIIFRHAEAESGESVSNDHERTLSKQGEISAALMGRALAKARELPEYALSSSAKRARSTLEIANQEGEWGCAIDSADLLYNTTSAEVLTLIHTFPAQHTCIMLVGHEPTWSTLTSQLVGGGNFRFRTGAMACIEFNTGDWNAIDFGRGSVNWFIQPGLFAR
jgi:phosphohistidine phosphatase